MKIIFKVVIILNSDIIQALSFVCSILGLVSMIVASLIKGKNMKTILFFVFCGNVLVAVSYLLGGQGINGAASCFVGGAQAIINYFFDSKNKPLPKWLVVIYALSFIVVNIVVSDGVSKTGIFISWLCLLVIVASLTFIMCIGQKSGAKYRFWTIVNNLLWCLYDVLSKSFGALTSHIPLLLFTVAGMIIHDRKSRKTEEASAEK